MTHIDANYQERTRRDFIYVATGAMGAIGVAASAWPFIDQMNPSADVLSLSTIEIDLSSVEPGQRVTVTWRGQPVFIDRRTSETVAAMQTIDLSKLRDPEPDDARVEKGEWLVVMEAGEILLRRGLLSEQQLRVSREAQSNGTSTIDKAVEMGVADRNRVGVGGHSYGAFMTANLMAHCDLFKAGVARSLSLIHI